METLPLRVEFGTTRTAEGLTLYRSEVERGTTLVAATEWTEHPVTAIRDGEVLLRDVRSDEALRDAQNEARALFALAH